MKILFLGSGTSYGVPMIGCDCEVCTSRDPRDRRTRPSVLLNVEGRAILIDTSTDLRVQAIRSRLRRLDAVLYTHAHADHVRGLDELRAFNLLQNGLINCYASPRTAAGIREGYSYVFRSGDTGGGVPRMNLIEFDGPFKAAGVEVTPVPLIHGVQMVSGFRVGRCAYLTDCNEIPRDSFRLLDGLDVLILDALRERPHPTHFSLASAIEAARRIGARRTFFTHISHNILHARTDAALPAGMHLAYDSLEIDCN